MGLLEQYKNETFDTWDSMKISALNITFMLGLCVLMHCCIVMCKKVMQISPKVLSISSYKHYIHYHYYTALADRKL